MSLQQLPVLFQILFPDILKSGPTPLPSYQYSVFWLKIASPDSPKAILQKPFLQNGLFLVPLKLLLHSLATVSFLENNALSLFLSLNFIKLSRSLSSGVKLFLSFQCMDICHFCSTQDFTYIFDQWSLTLVILFKYLSDHVIFWKYVLS